MSQQEVPLKETTTGSHIFYTTSFTLFEVIVRIIVLEPAQVLCQSSVGMDRRTIVKGESQFPTIPSVNGVGVLPKRHMLIVLFLEKSKRKEKRKK